jgi:hypothetical protein
MLRVIRVVPADATELSLIVESLLGTAHTAFQVRTWLIGLGLIAAAIVALLNWATLTVRALTTFVVVLCMILLFLSRGIP